jgi:hypothetical protein
MWFSVNFAQNRQHPVVKIVLSIITMLHCESNKTAKIYFFWAKKCLENYYKSLNIDLKLPQSPKFAKFLKNATDDEFDYYSKLNNIQ